MKAFSSLTSKNRIGLLSDKCPSSMSIMMKFGMRYRDEVCVFQAIGWMDDAGEMVEVRDGSGIFRGRFIFEGKNSFLCKLIIRQSYKPV